MILQALYRYAQVESLLADPDFPLMPVTWLVNVTANGRITGIVDTRVEVAGKGKKPKLVAKSFPVPYQSGRSGTKSPPNFLVDNAKYVFGRSTADKPFSPEEGAEKSGWFRDRVAKCAEATGDPGVSAVLSVLRAIASGELTVDLPAECRSNDLFAFVYEPDIDTLVHLRPAVREYWQAIRRPPAGEGSDGGFTCIVTGEPVRQPGLFPKVKNVPGAVTSGVPLVSFNARAFVSYGLDGNENAPISSAAAEACATALQRLLHPAFPDPRPGCNGQTLARRNYQLAGDTVACYWADRRSADQFLDAFSRFLEPDPNAVGELYDSVWRGRPASLNDAGVFYSLVVGGAQGRLVVRDWFTTSVSETVGHLREHFTDLEIVRITPPLKDRPVSPALPLRVLLESLAPFGRKDAIPAPLATEVFGAAVRGRPYPFALLQRAIERMRAEIGRSEWADLERRDARAALVKAVLNRRRRHQTESAYPELTVALDVNNTSPGYLCGRMMAVIERLQQVALPEANATVVDRFFGAASATPRAVFTRLLRNARHHARKARDDASTAGLTRWLEGQLDAITIHFDPERNGFPAFLDVEQQGLFMLGYHQQRHDLWRKRQPISSAVDLSSAEGARIEADAAVLSI